MAANTLPSGIGDLFVLAGRMEEGLETYGPWLLKGAITAEDFSELLTTTREAEAAFAGARAKKATAAKRFAAADLALTSWLAKARLVLMLALGSKWSESWLATGFTHRGTNVPKRIGPRIELARRLTGFFAEHPEYEVRFASVTEAEARALHQKVTAEQAEVRLTSAKAAAKKGLRDRAEKRLRRKMHNLVGTLSVVLAKNDPRWLAFGLNRPRPDSPPEQHRPKRFDPAIATVEFRVSEEVTTHASAAA